MSVGDQSMSESYPRRLRSLTDQDTRSQSFSLANGALVNGSFLHLVRRCPKICHAEVFHTGEGLLTGPRAWTNLISTDAQCFSQRTRDISQSSQMTGIVETCIAVLELISLARSAESRHVTISDYQVRSIPGHKRDGFAAVLCHYIISSKL